MRHQAASPILLIAASMNAMDTRHASGHTHQRRPRILRSATTSNVDAAPAPAAPASHRIVLSWLSNQTELVGHSPGEVTSGANHTSTYAQTTIAGRVTPAVTSMRANRAAPTAVRGGSGAMDEPSQTSSEFVLQARERLRVLRPLRPAPGGQGHAHGNRERHARGIERNHRRDDAQGVGRGRVNPDW
jgi:hypothetical protein